MAQAKKAATPKAAAPKKTAAKKAATPKKSAAPKVAAKPKVKKEKGERDPAKIQQMPTYFSPNHVAEIKKNTKQPTLTDAICFMYEKCFGRKIREKASVKAAAEA